MASDKTQPTREQSSSVVFHGLEAKADIKDDAKTPVNRPYAFLVLDFVGFVPFFVFLCLFLVCFTSARVYFCRTYDGMKKSSRRTEGVRVCACARLR